jgi:sialate O-acetylesterase
MNNTWARGLSRSAVVALLFSTQGWADAPALLHELFQDHAVLQRDKPIVVWGDASAGESVTIKLADHTTTATADSQGHWTADLPAMSAGGPYRLEARTSSGKQQAVNDVLVGDVYLCSGQSNMGMQVSRASNSYNEIQNASNDSIRMLTVAQNISIRPLRNFVAPVSWKVTSPETVGQFSAVCYYFARELQKTVRVPIGLIDSSWGGSKIEAWMSDVALRSVGGEDQKLDILKTFATEPAKGGAQWGAIWESWWRSRPETRGIPDPWSTTAPDSRWRVVPAGMQAWEKWGVAELEDYDGIVWYRTSFKLTPQQAKQRAQLSIGPVDEVDQTWFNGKPVGNTAGFKDATPADAFAQNRSKLGRSRVYYLDSGQLKAGENVVVVSILDTWGFGGLYGPAEQRQVFLADGTTIPLNGEWRYQIAPANLGAVPRAPWEAVAGLTTIRNAMIAPLGRYGLRGVAWYQGESNTEQPERYLGLMQGWMKDWRAQFGADLPFLIVQLANYGDIPTEPVESGWAGVREAQRLATVNDAHAGLAVTIDIGDPYDIHPTNKQEVGRRLARAARHVVYGEDVAPSGPKPVSAQRQGNSVTLTFDDVTDALVAYSSHHPIGFELCTNEPHSCRYAIATIQQKQVTLESAEVAAPTRVRYCWADSPICTLYDKAKLPAGPFQMTVAP